MDEGGKNYLITPNHMLSGGNQLGYLANESCTGYTAEESAVLAGIPRKHDRPQRPGQQKRRWTTEEDKALYNEYMLSKANKDFAKSDEIRNILLERNIL